MKAVVFDKTIITPGGQFIAYRTVYDIWAQGQWLSGHSVGSVELRHEQNTTNSISDFSEAYKRKWSFANVFVNCFKAKSSIETEFSVVCAE